MKSKPHSRQKQRKWTTPSKPCARGFYFFRRKTAPEFRLYMVVESGEVRHRTSLLLRRRIEEMLAEWSANKGFNARPVRLEWKVGINHIEME